MLDWSERMNTGTGSFASPLSDARQIDKVTATMLQERAYRLMNEVMCKRMIRDGGIEERCDRRNQLQCLSIY